MIRLYTKLQQILQGINPVKKTGLHKLRNNQVKRWYLSVKKRMEQRLRRAVTAALNNKTHSPIANFASIIGKQTINRNLKNYDKDTNRLVPEKFYYRNNRPD